MPTGALSWPVIGMSRCWPKTWLRPSMRPPRKRLLPFAHPALGCKGWRFKKSCPGTASVVAVSRRCAREYPILPGAIQRSIQPESGPSAMLRLRCQAARTSPRASDAKVAFQQPKSTPGYIRRRRSGAPASGTCSFSAARNRCAATRSTSATLPARVGPWSSNTARYAASAGSNANRTPSSR